MPPQVQEHQPTVAVGDRHHHRVGPARRGARSGALLYYRFCSFPASHSLAQIPALITSSRRTRVLSWEQLALVVVTTPFALTIDAGNLLEPTAIETLLWFAKSA